MSSQQTMKQRRELTRESLSMLQYAYGCRCPAGDHAQKIVRAARKFAKHWREWAGTPNALPDADTIEAAWRLAELLGMGWKEPRHE